MDDKSNFPMIFNASFESIDFEFELSLDRDQVCFEAYKYIHEEDIEDLQNGESAFYQLIIRCNKSDEQRCFYYPSIILSSDQNEVADELDIHLQEYNILEKIIENLKKS